MLRQNPKLLVLRRDLVVIPFLHVLNDVLDFLTPKKPPLIIILKCLCDLQSYGIIFWIFLRLLGVTGLASRKQLLLLRFIEFVQLVGVVAIEFGIEVLLGVTPLNDVS